MTYLNTHAKIIYIYKTLSASKSRSTELNPFPEKANVQATYTHKRSPYMHTTTKIDLIRKKKTIFEMSYVYAYVLMYIIYQF